MSGRSAPGRQARPARSRSSADAEQNKAAGGFHRRAVKVDPTTAVRGTIDLKVSRTTGAVHAHLRWRVNGKTFTRSLGEVAESTKAANLAEGWARARAMGLVGDEIAPSDSWATSAGVRASMRGNKGRDTRPERRLRSLLHQRGLRYRVSTRPVPELRRTADIVFPRARVAVFVDGCYWHGCPDHHRVSTKNSEFWRDKIAENKRRDAETTHALEERGWTVLRCWEHEDPAGVADVLVRLLRRATETSD
ncbi:hypothetical protein GCM10023148_04090 [Actinokineospora soli]